MGTQDTARIGESTAASSCENEWHVAQGAHGFTRWAESTASQKPGTARVNSPETRDNLMWNSDIASFCRNALRADVDYATPPLGSHGGKGVFGAEKRPAQDESHQPVPLVLFEFMDGRHVLDTGVVDKNIQTPEFPDRGLHQGTRVPAI